MKVRKYLITDINVNTEIPEQTTYMGATTTLMSTGEARTTVELFIYVDGVLDNYDLREELEKRLNQEIIGESPILDESI